VRPILLIAVALLALTTAAASAQSNDNLIVPNRRIGKVTIGMSVAQLYNVMGKPNKTDVFALQGESFYQFNDLDVGVANDDQLVGSVLTSSSKYKTAEGLGVGSENLELRAKGGEVCATQSGLAPGEVYIAYKEILFITDTQGKVRRVRVRRTGWRCN
jgi:hypothetical protein